MNRRSAIDLHAPRSRSICWRPTGGAGWPPACLVAAAAGVYAFVAKPSWLASQTLILRNEAANNETGPGKFNRTEELKSVEETIWSWPRAKACWRRPWPRSVRPPTRATEAWPSARDVDALRRLRDARAAQGRRVRHRRGLPSGRARCGPRSGRAGSNRAICDQLAGPLPGTPRRQGPEHDRRSSPRRSAWPRPTWTRRPPGWRQSRSSSAATWRSFAACTTRPPATAPCGAPPPRSTATCGTPAPPNRPTGSCSACCSAATSDPGRLLAMPNRLLDSQPALKRLKDGLVDAQLHTAALEGHMSAEHPLVIAAEEAEQRNRAAICDEELAVVAGSLEAELRLDAPPHRAAGEPTRRGQPPLEPAGRAAGRLRQPGGRDQSPHETRRAGRTEHGRGPRRPRQAKAASLISRIDCPTPASAPSAPARVTILLARPARRPGGRAGRGHAHGRPRGGRSRGAQLIRQPLATEWPHARASGRQARAGPGRCRPAHVRRPTEALAQAGPGEGD